jgi:hypothetical protein
VELADNVTLNGAAVSFADTVNSSTTDNRNLTIDATGDVTFSGAVGNTADQELNTIAIVNSSNTTFSEAVTASTIDIQDTDGTVAFQGDTTLTNGLTTATEPYNVSFSGGSTQIAGDTTFENTGNIALGDDSTDTLTFTGELTVTDVAEMTIDGAVSATSIDINANTISTENFSSLTVTAGKSITLIAQGTDSSVNISRTDLLAPEGVIQVFGNDIDILDNSEIDVSGGDDGGVVLIGANAGNFADTVSVESNVSINALADPPDDEASGRVRIFYSDPDSAGNINPNVDTEDFKAISANPTPPEVTSPAPGEPARFENFVIVDEADPRLDPVAADPVTAQLFETQTISIDVCGGFIFCFFPPVQIPVFVALNPTNLLIPETVIEGTKFSTFFGNDFFTRPSGFALEAKNNFTIENLDNPLTLDPDGGRAAFIAGNLFTMNNAGDPTREIIQTRGRDLVISGATVEIGTAEIDTRSIDTTDSGSLLIQADNQLTLSDSALRSDRNNTITTGSFIQLESKTGSTTLTKVNINAGNQGEGRGGSIFVNAPETVTIAGSSNISSDGRSGEIFIGSSLNIAPNANFSPIPLGRTSPNATTVPNEAFIRESVLETQFALNTASEAQGGIIDIQAANLVEIAANSRLSSSTVGTASAGNINVETKNDGTIAVINSTLLSTASANATGSAGAVQLQNAAAIILEDGSTIRTSSSSTSEDSGAGFIELQAETGEVKISSSTIENTVVNGPGGRVNIEAQTVEIAAGSVVNASTTGEGIAGDIEIITASDTNPDTPDLVIDNSQIEAVTSSPDVTAGSAGRISLIAENGGDVEVKNGSTISSSTTGSGTSGGITVESQDFRVTGGATVQARSEGGTGAPGSISLNIAESLVVSGTSPGGQISEISTFSGPNAQLTDGTTNCLSDASQCVGSIRINSFADPVNSLLISDRGRINSQTQSTDASQQGGSIEVFTNTLDRQSGGQITTASTGAAQAGSIRVRRCPSRNERATAKAVGRSAREFPG